MTTDTLPKGASRQFQFDGKTITVTGISKGAGMIRPNMATMLGYIATDAKVAPAVLKDLMLDGANKSFNRITIDGDTSTNDCCMLIATGKADVPEVTEARGELFDALKKQCLKCAWTWPRPSSVTAKVLPSSSPCRSTVVATTRNAWTSATPWPTRR